MQATHLTMRIALLFVCFTLAIFIVFYFFRLILVLFVEKGIIISFIC